MDIDFTNIYIFRTIVCVGEYCNLACIIALATFIISSIFYFAAHSFYLSNLDSAYSNHHCTGQKNIVRLFSNLSIKSLVICLITGFITIFIPSDKEYNMYLVYKVANAASKSEIGTKSQEVLINWLNTKLNELQKDSFTNNTPETSH